MPFHHLQISEKGATNYINDNTLMTFPQSAARGKYD